MLGFLIPFSNPFFLLFIIVVMIVFWISYDAVYPSPEFVDCTSGVFGFETLCIEKFTPEAYGAYLVWLVTKIGFMFAVLFIIRIFGQRRNVN